MAVPARILGLATALLLASTSTAAAAPSPPLSQHGRWLTDSEGRVALLHGVNMVYKRRPYHPSAIGFDGDDAAFLRREGFNTVRLGVIYAGVEPQKASYDDGYLAAIARTADLLTRERIFWQLDFHQDLYNERYQGEGWPDWAVRDDGLPAEPKTGFPGNYVAMPALSRAFDHFWANSPPVSGGAGLQDYYANAWRHVANRFKGEAYLMGYDLMNEPWPGSAWPTCANPAGCPVFDEQSLTPFSRRTTNRIREVDSRNVVWYEPNVIFNNGPMTHHGDTGTRAGMSFHVYCLTDTNSPSPFDPAQSAQCGSASEELPFQRAEEQSARTGDALLLSEFGATDDLEQIDRVIEKAERHMVSWQYWHYCQCDDPTTVGVGPTQAVVIDPRRSPSGDNLKSDKLEVLSRAYPQAIAGTPIRYDFDRGRRSFELEYSTARVGGGTLSPYADTQIFVPRRHFPGYDVVTQGGEPSSATNAEELTVRNCPGRPRVKVTLVRGSGRVFADCRAPRVNRAGRRLFRIRLKATPRRTVARRRVRFRFRATIRLRRRVMPVKRARLRFGPRARRTNARGRVTLRRRLRRPGRYRARATKRGLAPGRATIRVRRRRR